MMKKISYLVLILILLILIVNMFSSNKPIVHKKKKIEQKEGLIEKVKITPNIKIKLVEKKEDNKTKKKEVKEENVKYCLEKSEYSYGKTVNYTYENGLLIKIEKNYNGNRDSIILEYNGKDKVESKQLEFINYSTENVLNAIVNYTYDDDYDFSHKKLSKEDFEYLFVDFSLSIICPNDNIDMRYHEEFDDNGRLISANIMQKNTLLKTIKYKYDNQGNLFSKTKISSKDVGKRETIYYTKSGKISSIYKEDPYNFMNILLEQRRMYREGRSKDMNETQRRKVYKKSSNWFWEQLLSEDFPKNLKWRYIYDDNGKLIRKYDVTNDKNITYKYDNHGNLIEKRKGDKVLLRQFFKVCE